jgi:16S rRNA (adenine1518-N6/adenine1519-N6)-dimethyltransferase
MLNTSEIKKIFKERGLTPKKWMGQNLFVDQRYLDQIVDSAGLSENDTIVEIGAGLGVLTEALLHRGAEVYALEVDSGFYRVLETRFADTPKVHLIHADALKFDFCALAEKIGRLKVVANLPYSISSRLIFTFHENRQAFDSLVIMLQKEVARRLVAEPGTRDYGILTVLLGVSANAGILFDIPPNAFFPAPDIVSTLIRIDFPVEEPVHVTDPELMIRLVKASFAGRRKTLRNTLKNCSAIGVESAMVMEAAQSAGIDLARRAETLTPSEFAGFANEICSLNIKSKVSARGANA